MQDLDQAATKNQQQQTNLNFFVDGELPSVSQEQTPLISELRSRIPNQDLIEETEQSVVMPQIKTAQRLPQADNTMQKAAKEFMKLQMRV